MGVVLLLESGGRDPVVVALRCIIELSLSRPEDVLASDAFSARATRLFCEGCD